MQQDPGVGATESLLLPHAGSGLVAGRAACQILLPLPDLLQSHKHLAEEGYFLIGVLSEQEINGLGKMVMVMTMG